ncbi:MULTISPECIES: tRNA (guanosine(46)-N7)-methyltransferase TrmB [Kocuria]|uniref:tRNA (guanosine(46)-N7)-methyltransferase TrmB n=1 Tax=Kocuria TaxID=57493 RepID=UPI001F61301A|nr:MULTISPECIES: tRNA (guanosine(46)-N7)-methyltransferase TrmB [Kocuria]MDT0119732.1 tRNA (guanosine(46)-N7)-methyltransferase TrmB [Kocuria sp. PD6]
MESSDRTPDTSAHDAALPDSAGSAPEASPAPEHRTEQPAEARAAGAAPSSSEHTEADATPTNDSAPTDAGAPTGPAAATGGAPAGVAFPRQPYSFVRRGDRLSPKRQKAWDEHADEWVLDIPRVMTDTSVDPAYRLDREAVFGRVAPVVVEVGSGLGEAIVAHAAAHPELDHLAVEVYKPGVADLLMKAAQAGVTNVRVAQANAPEVLEHMLEPGSVHELWVFFPDPWHKTRHHKRRLVSPGFAELAARVLEPGGLWRLATDWQEYAVVMREVLDGADADFENVHPGQPADDEHPDAGWAPRWEGRILTSFERKATEAGRIPRDLTYRRR